MPKVKLKNADLQKVKDKSALFALLRGPLGWPLIEDDENFTYPIADVGNVNVQQLLPFANDDPWLILLVEFDGPFRRDDVRKALREIRRQQRQYGRYEGKGISDILFICVAQHYQEIQFVRFVERGSRRSKLKVFGWNPGTQNENKTVCEVCLPALALEVTEEGQPDWSKARWSQAWDVEKVTRDFFNGFDRLRKETLALLQPAFGADTEAANWATSVQLNRLLFVYFLADQGFLPGGVKRLQTALEGGDFHTWFRTLALDALGSNGNRPEGFADIPYLNGGLFVLHETEQGRKLQLTDAHYSQWLDFLGSFRWTLSESEGVNTISPHILGYLFERYINQKQMGAYYTKEDVTGYICRSVVIPRLFDKIAEARGKAVHLDIGALSNEGNRRYFFPSVKQRAYLPTETPYEYQRRQERLRRLEKADLHAVDDFVTNNLNLELLAEDWLATRKDPAELLAAYDALQSITILDPTVGSGAFLLAALEILAPLYDFALRRMEAMIKEAGEAIPLVNWAGELNLEEAFDQKVLADPAESETIGAMRGRLAEVAKHENSGYFIRKRILLNNLYGVDVMPEAVEICKLRLYLALISAATSTSKLEPLPDVDLNFRAGNTLVGFATLQEIQQHFNPKGTLGLEFGEEYLIRASVRKIQEINRRQESGEAPHELIEEIEYERRIAVQSLDRQQATIRNFKCDEQFLRSHRPFHWLAEFPTVILERGGFDCIVGNPPYVRWTKIPTSPKPLGLATQECPDIYAAITDRSIDLLTSQARLGMILPLSITFGKQFASLRERLQEGADLRISSFDNIPAALFSGVSQRCSIVLRAPALERHNTQLFTSGLQRWRSEARTTLLERLSLVPVDMANTTQEIPKLFDEPSQNLYSVITEMPVRVAGINRSWLGYSTTARNYLTPFVTPPPSLRPDLTPAPPSNKTGQLDLRSQDDALAALATIASETAFVWWLMIGDGFDVTGSWLSRLTNILPLSGSIHETLKRIGGLLEANRSAATQFKLNAEIYIGSYNWRRIPELVVRADYAFGAAIGLQLPTVRQLIDASASVRSINTSAGERGIPAIVRERAGASDKVQIDTHVLREIDSALARHYGIQDEDLELMINYDIKNCTGSEEVDS